MNAVARRIVASVSSRVGSADGLAASAATPTEPKTTVHAASVHTRRSRPRGAEVGAEDGLCMGSRCLLRPVRTSLQPKCAALPGRVFARHRLMSPSDDGVGDRRQRSATASTPVSYVLTFETRVITSTFE